MEHEKELTAMSGVLSALAGLDEDACGRIIRYAAEVKGISLPNDKARQNNNIGQTSNVSDDVDVEAANFSTFAEFYNATTPKTGAEKALVTGYWLQCIKSGEDFGGAAVNKELQHVGEALANVTDAFNKLMAKKPKLAIQTRKSGKSQQARKLYKLTDPGIRTVGVMLKKAEQGFES